MTRKEKIEMYITAIRSELEYIESHYRDYSGYIQTKLIEDLKDAYRIIKQ